LKEPEERLPLAAVPQLTTGRHLLYAEWIEEQTRVLQKRTKCLFSKQLIGFDGVRQRLHARAQGVWYGTKLSAQDGSGQPRSKWKIHKLRENR